MFVLALVLFSAYSQSSQLDINRATLRQIRDLPVDSLTAERIYAYVDAYGRLNSIYDLLKIPGVSARKLEELKPIIYVTQRDWEEGKLNNIQRIQRRLASEEGPTATAVEDWQDLLLSPVNVNRAKVDDLLVLDNVSLVDAVSVARFLKAGGKLGGRRDLAGQVPGLSSYGYRSMRDYVAYDEVKGFGFGGNYRANYETDPNWFVQANATDFDQALTALDTDTAQFRTGGYDSADVASFRRQLEAEREFRAKMHNQASARHRLRVRVGDYVRAGGWAVQKFYGQTGFERWKAFASVQDLGPVRRLFVGDYRLTLGQGLLLDNNSELMARVHERPQGLFNDLSENTGFGFRGGATELGVSRFGLLGFYSNAGRDAILNPDSTVNYYIMSTPRYPTFADAVTETDMGGSARLDLSDLLFIPTGTRLAFNALQTETDRRFNPDPKYLDVPGDAEVLNDPNYTRLSSGRSRQFYGSDFRIVIENVSLEGEAAVRPVPEDTLGLPMAYIAKARTQYDNLYLTVLYRHYDVAYDNPYNRGFCEQLRFEDTPLEKTYRVIDPAYAALQDFPMPKAEQGFFLDTRYQIGRQVTFTRVYLDVWRNLAWSADNVRFQGEVEYLPVYPVRLRFKQKLQSKETPKAAVATRSFTSETSIRAMTSLSNWDYLTAELRAGRVYLTPTMEYSDQASMSGGFLSVQWEHNFSDDFNGELGVATWLASSMSQWTFEDNGIDFLEGQGFRWYLALTDRVSDNLLAYLKFRHKVTDFPHTGLGNAEGLHFPGSSEPVRDFVTRDNSFDVALQVDLLW